MKQLNWRTFLVFLLFLSATAFAQQIFSGGDEDVFVYDSILIDGAEMPADFSATTGTTTVDVAGAGSVTVANRNMGGDLRLTIFGGTTLSVSRLFAADDVKTWWEGTVNAPQKAKKPSTDLVSFVTAGNHVNSWVNITDTYGMGESNEQYSFSPAARFRFPVSAIDGTKLWLAKKTQTPPAESAEAEWTITEGEFCIVRDGECELDVTSITAIAFAQELFTVCPRSSSSNTQIENGAISGPPLCAIACHRGYELNDELTRCVATEEAAETPVAPSSPTGQSAAETDESASLFQVPPGYFRYTGARDQMDRQISTDSLVGEELTRAKRQNLSAQGRGAEEEAALPENADGSAANKDSFINYLLQIRNIFGENSNKNVYSAETTAEGETPSGEGEVHSSAPLLPSTGPGVFVGLSALGLGLMAIGGRRRR